MTEETQTHTPETYSIADETPGYLADYLDDNPHALDPEEAQYLDLSPIAGLASHWWTQLLLVGNDHALGLDYDPGAERWDTFEAGSVRYARDVLALRRADSEHYDDTRPVCRFCGSFIDEPLQDCAALHDGRCEQ